MRFSRPLFAVSAVFLSSGCAGIGALEALGGSCTQEQIVVTWPVTIAVRRAAVRC